MMTDVKFSFSGLMNHAQHKVHEVEVKSEHIDNPNNDQTNTSDHENKEGNHYIALLTHVIFTHLIVFL